MLIAGHNITQIASFKKDIDERFEITDLGKIHYVLGLQIRRDRPNHIIYLNQSRYIDSILERFGMSTCHPIAIPLVTNHNLSLLQCPQTEDEHISYKLYLGGINYLSLIGSLLYATQTCPNIQFTVNLLARFSDNPGINHFAACKRVLHYLKGTKKYCLRLGGLSINKMRLVGWSDANWAQDSHDR